MATLSGDGSVVTPSDADLVVTSDDDVSVETFLDAVPVLTPTDAD